MTARHSFAELASNAVLAFSDGYRTKKAELGDSGFPVLRVAEVDHGRIAPTYVDHVRAEFASKIGSKLSQAGDVLLTTKGTVGRRAIMPATTDRFAYSPQLCFFRVTDDDVLDRRWLYYWLGSREFWSQASGVSQQTDMAPYISLRDLREIRLPLPAISEQRAIAATLGALDDKIESNRRIAEILPGFIRASVNRALAGGNDVVPVSLLAEFVNGGAYTKGATGTGRMVIRIAELNKGPGGSTVYNDIDVPDEKTARPGDILMSWSGTLDVYRWFRNEAIVNQHIFKVLPRDVPAWLVFDRLRDVITIFQGIAKDKTTTMGHIKRSDLDTTVETPRRSDVRALDQTLGPLWDRWLVAERETLRLIALRDVLLPELLSGRIRVVDAAATVAEATA